MQNISWDHTCFLLKSDHTAAISQHQMMLVSATGGDAFLQEKLGFILSINVGLGGEEKKFFHENMFVTIRQLHYVYIIVNLHAFRNAYLVLCGSWRAPLQVQHRVVGTSNCTVVGPSTKLRSLTVALQEAQCGAWVAEEEREQNDSTMRWSAKEQGLGNTSCCLHIRIRYSKFIPVVYDSVIISNLKEKRRKRFWTPASQ